MSTYKQFWPTGQIANLFVFENDSVETKHALCFSDDGVRRGEYNRAIIHKNYLLAYDVDGVIFAWNLPINGTTLGEAVNLNNLVRAVGEINI